MSPIPDVAGMTRFTTAAGYDKIEGTAPVVNAVHLWRVRYPVADIGSGNCVFAEYHGFITVDYDPGTVPNTPAASDPARAATDQSVADKRPSAPLP